MPDLKTETMLAPYSAQDRRAALEQIEARRAALLEELAQLDAMQAGHRAALEIDQAA